MSSQNVRVGFIGAGNMAQAIGGCLLKKGKVSASDLIVSAPSDRNLFIWKDLGVNVTTNNEEVVSRSSIIFLAMKPQYLDEVLRSLTGVTRKHPMVFVSILAGVSISTIKKKFKVYFSWYDEHSIAFVRVMPNTPVFVGAGCYLICYEEDFQKKEIIMCNEYQKKLEDMLSAGGSYEVIKEPLFNSLSGLSGSGPAYMYLIIEALSDGAVKVGAPRDLAIRLAAQTMIGAGEMVLKSGKHPGELKDNVCSPGGTTIAAIHSLENSSLRGALISAVEAAYNRAEEIKQQFQTDT